MTSTVQTEMLECKSELISDKNWQLFGYFSAPDGQAKFMSFFTLGERQHCQALDIITHTHTDTHLQLHARTHAGLVVSLGS